MSKIKKKRSISGIWFRFKNPEAGKFENRCFEDLPEEEQDRCFKDQSPEWAISLAKTLAARLRWLADEVDVSAEIEN